MDLILGKPLEYVVTLLAGASMRELAARAHYQHADRDLIALPARKETVRFRPVLVNLGRRVNGAEAAAALAEMYPQYLLPDPRMHIAFDCQSPGLVDSKKSEVIVSLGNPIVTKGFERATDTFFEPGGARKLYTHFYSAMFAPVVNFLLADMVPL